MTTQVMNETTTDELVERIFGAVLGAMDVFSIYVGDKLGLYEALVANGSMTRDELCAATGMHQRYADEWLEQQVTTGFLGVNDPKLDPNKRSYVIGAAASEVFADQDSLAFLTPFARLVMAGALQLPRLLEAYTEGGGVSWMGFGSDMRTGQAEMNRPWFLSEIGSSWFPSVPGLHQRLSDGGRVADVGCGEGWSSIAIALAYPNVEVVGIDIDEASVHAARTHADAAGVSDRVAFQLADAGAADTGETFDVVTAFECIHDMPDPVSVLKSIRRLVSGDGWVVVMDEAVGDAFGDRRDEIERLFYGFSLFVCLPDGMSHRPSAATGAVMRPSTMERYAVDAGFSGIEILPIENDLWRFYRLNIS